MRNSRCCLILAARIKEEPGLSRPALFFLVQGGLSSSSETTPVGWPGCSVAVRGSEGHLKEAEMGGERDQSRC